MLIFKTIVISNHIFILNIKFFSVMIEYYRISRYYEKLRESIVNVARV
jgi:hypothetical protein